MLIQGIWYFPILGVAVVLHWLARRSRRLRLAFLLGASLATIAFLLWRNLDNRMVAVLLATLLSLSCMSYFFGVMQTRARSPQWLVVGLVLPFSAFLVASQVPVQLAGTENRSLWIIPISIGFFALRQVNFVYECYRGQVKQTDLLTYLTFVFFLPTIIAGPLERFGRFADQTIASRVEWTDLSVGTERIVVGAFKKFVVADLLLAAMLPPEALSRSAFGGAAWDTLLFACAIKFLFVYFDFAGYTDMAIGTARFFGYTLPENFNFPLVRANLAEFWRAWHMSLSNFARDYVYFPLLAKYRNPALAVVATMVVIAAWHGTTPGWLLWGLHHGIGLVALARFQRLALRLSILRALRRTLAWRFAAVVCTWLFVAFGYALTWHPEDVAVSLAIYASIWSFGLLR